MIISIIAALAKDRVIGKNNTLPWDLPADMKHFRSLSKGKPIIMGLKTFQSIGHPLPKRDNIVLSRDLDYKLPNCWIANSIDQALSIAKQSPLGRKSKEVMICGGASVYEQFLPLTHRMYLTFIDAHLQGDAYFPKWNPNQWQEKENTKHQPDKQNPYPYSFITLERKFI